MVQSLEGRAQRRRNNFELSLDDEYAVLEAEKKKGS